LCLQPTHDSHHNSSCLSYNHYLYARETTTSSPRTEPQTHHDHEPCSLAPQRKLDTPYFLYSTIQSIQQYKPRSSSTLVSSRISSRIFSQYPSIIFSHVKNICISQYCIVWIRFHSISFLEDINAVAVQLLLFRFGFRVGFGPFFDSCSNGRIRTLCVSFFRILLLIEPQGYSMLPASSLTTMSACSIRF
jgi:hypothetical protein